MHRLARFVVLALFFVVHQPAVAQEPSAYNYDVLNAHLWQQTSEEYRGLSLQAYGAARLALDLALSDSSRVAAVEQVADARALPPAIIVDVDETVLDNSPYATRMVRGKTRYARESWEAWVKEERAAALPGAVEFLRYAASRGVTVFYVTNRDAALQEATRANLRKQGFPLRDDLETVFTRGSKPEWKDSDKAPRRKFVAQSFRIVLLMGDDLNDFLSGVKTSPAERAATAAAFAGYWGSRWILLPNPVYGSWEDALLHHERGLPEEEILRRKLEALEDDPDPQGCPH